MARLLSKKHRLKKCPNCKMIVQKSKGCDHMTCYCSFEFCYLCNEVYTINHKCSRPKAENCLKTMFLELERDDSLYNKFVHCGKMLDCLTPDPEKNRCWQTLYIIVFTLTVYPVISFVLCMMVLGAFVFWLIVFVIAIAIYLVFYPFL